MRTQELFEVVIILVVLHTRCEHQQALDIRSVFRPNRILYCKESVWTQLR